MRNQIGCYKSAERKCVRLLQRTALNHLKNEIHYGRCLFHNMLIWETKT